MESPDKAGRESILKVHALKKELPLGDDVDLSDIARMTTGFTGYSLVSELIFDFNHNLLLMHFGDTYCRADLANLVNEAALLAGRQTKVVVEKIDFIQAVERSIAVCLLSCLCSHGCPWLSFISCWKDSLQYALCSFMSLIVIAAATYLHFCRMPMHNIH